MMQSTQQNPQINPDFSQSQQNPDPMPPLPRVYRVTNWRNPTPEQIKQLELYNQEVKAYLDWWKRHSQPDQPSQPNQVDQLNQVEQPNQPI
ncbi:MAG: hypothetical protein WAW52_01735 [Methanothrix sp.]